MEIYTSLKNQSSARYTERKSEFVSFAAPVGSEEEAAAFISAVKKRLPGANHYVYAYILRSGAARCSDDGEPSGTAGKPTLNLLEKTGLTNAVIITARFYGGIMLGAGGLVRAYSMSAARSLEAGETVRYAPFVRFTLEYGYPAHKPIENELRRLGAIIGRAVYGEKIKLSAAVRKDLSVDFREKIIDITAGQALITEEGEGFEADSGG